MHKYRAKFKALNKMLPITIIQLRCPCINNNQNRHKFNNQARQAPNITINEKTFEAWPFKVTSIGK